MVFSFGPCAAVVLATLALTTAQAPPADRFQEVGNELGRIQSSVGQLRHANTANAYQLSSAAQAYDAVLATSIPELRTTGFENLSPEAARQHAQNIEQYVNILLNDNAQLHDEASRAAAREQQIQAEYYQQAPPQPYQGQAIRPGNLLAATGIPAFRNKAVVKDESTTTSAASTSETASSTTTENSKSESKESKSEAKSESKEAKSESKSESKASKKSEHAAAANGTSVATSTHGAAASSNATTTATRTKGHKSKNGAANYGMTGGALVAGAVLALL